MRPNGKIFFIRSTSYASIQFDSIRFLLSLNAHRKWTRKFLEFNNLIHRIHIECHVECEMCDTWSFNLHIKFAFFCLSVCINSLCLWLKSWFLKFNITNVCTCDWWILEQKNVLDTLEIHQSPCAQLATIMTSNTHTAKCFMVYFAWKWEWDVDRIGIW